MDSIENLVKFLNSYPTWAKLLALTGIAVSIATLVFAPRTPLDAQAQDRPQAGGPVLRMLGVVLFPPNPYVAVRVTAYVNGTPFRYPSLAGVEWLKVGPAMSSQAFQLPKSDKYEVRFEMAMKGTSPGTTGEFVSQQVVTVTKLPHSGDYNVYRKEEGVGVTRSASVEAAVRFALDPAP